VHAHFPGTHAKRWSHRTHNFQGRTQNGVSLCTHNLQGRRKTASLGTQFPGTHTKTGSLGTHNFQCRTENGASVCMHNYQGRTTILILYTHIIQGRTQKGVPVHAQLPRKRKMERSCANANSRDATKKRVPCAWKNGVPVHANFSGSQEKVACLWTHNNRGNMQTGVSLYTHNFQGCTQKSAYLCMHNSHGRTQDDASLCTKNFQGRTQKCPCSRTISEDTCKEGPCVRTIFKDARVMVRLCARRIYKHARKMVRLCKQNFQGRTKRRQYLTQFLRAQVKKGVPVHAQFPGTNTKTESLCTQNFQGCRQKWGSSESTISRVTRKKQRLCARTITTDARKFLRPSTQTIYRDRRKKVDPVHAQSPGKHAK
jgi:hypothetical protein